METIEIQVALQIRKPVEIIFEAITNPLQMAHYFIEQGSARMESNTTIEWKFPEFDERFMIQVVKVKPFGEIIFDWEGIVGKTTRVRIALTSTADNNTLVKIREGRLPADRAGLTWYGQNTEGWANFLASLKAWTEYGVNIRSGAYDFLVAQ